MNRESIAKIITQVDLALLSEISTRQLSDIETAKVSTTIDTLSKI